MRKILLAVALVAFFALPTAVAQAQTTSTTCPGYPGCTTTTAAGPTSQTQQLGDHQQGDTFIIESCGFSQGVTLQLNGNGAGDDTLNSAGCAQETVTIVEDGVGLGAARFAAAGLHVAAPTPQVRIDGRLYTAKAGSNDLTVFGIGTNGANRTVHNLFNIAGRTGGGALPRTGAMILRWSLAALALMAVGTLLVLADRRRKAAPIHAEHKPRP
jgi:hypothetical protein